MTPKTISAWIDQLRGMLDDPLVSCEQAVRDVVDCELDALELQLLREAVTEPTCSWRRDHLLGCWTCTAHNAAHRTSQPPERCHKATKPTQTITVNVQATGAAQLAREIAQALSPGRRPRLRP